jgi:hypothetical protein
LNAQSYEICGMFLPLKSLFAGKLTATNHIFFQITGDFRFEGIELIFIFAAANAKKINLKETTKWQQNFVYREGDAKIILSIKLLLQIAEHHEMESILRG